MQNRRLVEATSAAAPIDLCGEVDYKQSAPRCRRQAGKATDCKSVIPRFKSGRHLPRCRARAIGPFSFAELFADGGCRIDQEDSMRVFMITICLAAALPAYANRTGFSSAMTEVQKQTRTVRDGFSGIAQLEVAQKGAALAPHADHAASVVTRLEGLTPPPASAACYSDALDGARRAAASMQDMLRIYRDGGGDAGFAPRITSAARHVDDGLTELEHALTACGAGK
jgi:hypothetical protein